MSVGSESGEELTLPTVRQTQRREDAKDLKKGNTLIISAFAFLLTIHAQNASLV